MTQEENKRTSHYELLYIVSNKYSEKELGPIMQKTNKTIEENDGKIGRTEEWGKKRLAYPIKNFTFGYYTLVEFDAPKESIEKINTILRMNNEVLRHSIVARVPKTEKEIEEAKRRTQKQAIQAIKKDEKKEVKKEKASDKKVDLKKLDEKLDKILETDDLL